MSDRHTYAAALQQLDLFQGLGADDLASIASVAEPKVFPAGHTIARQGEADARFYLIFDGQVRVDVGGRFEERLGPGAYFGEISVIDGAPRSASVVAETDVRTLSLAHGDLLQLFEQCPSIATSMLHELCRRLRLSREIRPTD